LTTLPKIGKEFCIKFEIIVTKRTTSGHASGVHFTTGGNCCANGQRIPGLWFTPTGLGLVSAISGNGNSYSNTPIEVNKWTEVKFSQALEGGFYIHRTSVGGKEVRKAKNTKPEEFTDVKVYAADPWYPTQEGYVKQILVRSEPCSSESSTLPAITATTETTAATAMTTITETGSWSHPAQLEFKKGTLLTTLPKIGKEFCIKFEIIVTKRTTSGHASGVHFTTGGNCCANGQRIPGLWFTPTGLGLVSAISGNGNSYSNTPIEVNKWTEVKFSQALEGGFYIHRTSVGGKEVRKAKNTKPEEFTDVKVYAADPWYPTQEGYVKQILVRSEPCSSEPVELDMIVQGASIIF